MSVEEAEGVRVAFGRFSGGVDAEGLSDCKLDATGRYDVVVGADVRGGRVHLGER